ncbi:hypothetical protein AMECASPLE_004473, partial [Ameca splendens]
WASCRWETLERTLLPTPGSREPTCLSTPHCRQQLKTARCSKWILPTTRLLTVNSASNAQARLQLCEPEGSWEVAEDITGMKATACPDWTRYTNIFFAQPRHF